MIVVLFRHGHKDFNPSEDPPLSPKGFDQAIKLAEIVNSQMLPQPTHCWSSLKLRTFQTLEKMIQLTSCKSERINELNIRSYSENNLQFRTRIQKFLNFLDLKSKKPEHRHEVHFVCTHYDWIEEAMTLIQCDKNLSTFEYASWAPAQYLIFEIQDHTWHLTKKGVIS